MSAPPRRRRAETTARQGGGARGDGSPGPDAESGAAWKRRDAHHHDVEAPRYDELIGREFAPYQDTHTAFPWAAALAARGAEVVVDVGCGTGRTSIPAAAAGPGVIAVDMSCGMLARARTKAGAVGVGSRVWPLIADAERLPIADRTVDGVVCQGVLHHLPGVRRALMEMDRIVVRGAPVYLAEPGADASVLYRMVRVLGRFVGRMLSPLRRLQSPASDDERPLDPSEILGPLAEMGYRTDATYLVHPPLVYRFVPRWLGRRLVRWLNPGDRSRSRRADIVVVRAVKTADGGESPAGARGRGPARGTDR